MNRVKDPPKTFARLQKLAMQKRGWKAQCVTTGIK